MDDDSEYTRITLRIPKALHEKLVRSSKATSKSMNAEILARIELAFQPAISEDPRLISALHEQIALLKWVIKHTATLIRSILASSNQREMTHLERTGLRHCADDLWSVASKDGNIPIPKNGESNT